MKSKKRAKRSCTSSTARRGGDAVRATLGTAVVVGGGVAGLCTGWLLAASNRYRSVTLYDARPRLGGRVSTARDRSGGVQFERAVAPGRNAPRAGAVRALGCAHPEHRPAAAPARRARGRGLSPGLPRARCRRRPLCRGRRRRPRHRVPRPDLRRGRHSLYVTRAERYKILPDGIDALVEGLRLLEAAGARCT